MYPWTNRAMELSETEGPYCDLVAFEEWIRYVWPPSKEHTFLELVDLYSVITDLMEVT